jgi:tRNA(Ile)-lysidine synthase
MSETGLTDGGSDSVIALEAPAKCVAFSEASLVRRVIAVIRRRRLFQPGNKILVAVSGGPDSTALLCLLHGLQREWNLDLSVLHVNYGLRGTESDEDESFVRRLCHRLAVPCIVRSADLSHRVKGPRPTSLQEQARDIRYRIMKEVAAAQSVDKIALGHTADDQAETILLWLLRGAGLTGLAGMPIVREGLFIRPLLTITRLELIAYLASREIEFRTDSTNAKSLYRRNRIRHELMPCITSLAPSFMRLMERQSDVLGEEDRLLEQLVTDWLPQVLTRREGQHILDRSVLLNAPLALQRRLVRRVLRLLNHRGVASRFAVVDTILRQVVAGSSGARLIAGGIEVVREGGMIRLTRHAESKPVPPLRPAIPVDGIGIDIPGFVTWPGTGERIAVEFVGGTRARNLLRSHSKRVALFDASTFTPRLVVRGWQSGDRFAPSGLHGKQKKLQDFFIDSKLSRSDRRRIPLLSAPEGILWIVGHRADERFAATFSTKTFVMAVISTGSSIEGRD